MTYHKLLQRQLKKHAVENLTVDNAFLNFIQAVSDSYTAFDRDKELSDHAFMVSQQEFADINSQLAEEIELRKLSIQKLKNTLEQVTTENRNNTDSSELNVLELVEMLNQEIAKRKEAENQLLLAKTEAENASKIKSEFLSVISHELRTPLNAVIGMGHLLVSNNPRPDQLENLQALRTSADNLLLLINDILDFNKMEVGKPDLESTPFDLKVLVQDVVNLNLSAATKRENSIVVDFGEKLPEQFIGDQVRIGQVLNNLISNAIKFTKSGTITISIKVREQNDDVFLLDIAVKDTGVGIARQHQALIFEPFTQISTSMTRQYGGTGLGLAITKRILALMESEISVESILGKGSTFYFTLTLPGQSNDRQGKLKQEPSSKNTAHILLVEDTPFNVLYAVQLLEGWDFSVDVAENGAVAVHKIEKGTYDLILMDLQMPVMDGYSAALAIREFNTNIPIIALTASATSNVRQKVMAVGMQDSLTKPYNPEELLGKIHLHINQNR